MYGKVYAAVATVRQLTNAAVCFGGKSYPKQALHGLENSPASLPLLHSASLSSHHRAVKLSHSSQRFIWSLCQCMTVCLSFMLLPPFPNGFTLSDQFQANLAIGYQPKKMFSRLQKNRQGEGIFYNDERATVWLPLRLDIGEFGHKPWLCKAGMPLTLLLVQYFDSHARRSIQSFGYLSRESGYVSSTGSKNQLITARCFHTWRNLLSWRLLLHHQIYLTVAKGWVGRCWEKGPNG